MAFSATINNVQYQGPSKRELAGTWTGSAGDAAGTMSISGTVVSAIFEKLDVDNTFQGFVRCSNSVSSGISTLTVNNQDNVVNGVFTIKTLG